MEDSDTDASVNGIDLSSPKVIEQAIHAGDNGKL